LGLPVYLNVGLTDAKILDAQAGFEKSASLALGALAGADLVGHAGICGHDHGASLEWLVADDELMGFARRLVRGFEVTPETLAAEVIQAVGPGGSYLAEEHTVRHFREELWIPGSAWTRQSWGAWADGGRTSLAQRVADRGRELLSKHVPPPIDAALGAEIDRIVACARKEFV
jgi:trimethylamine--corrinoid protein Co-methyltransferase